MTKQHMAKAFREPPGDVVVPDADEMDDEDFLRHLDKRHKMDTGVEAMLVDHPDRAQTWIRPYRAFHNYVHRHNEYNHIHEEDD